MNTPSPSAGASVDRQPNSSAHTGIAFTTDPLLSGVGLNGTSRPKRTFWTQRANDQQSKASGPCAPRL